MVLRGKSPVSHHSASAEGTETPALCYQMRKGFSHLAPQNKHPSDALGRTSTKTPAGPSSCGLRPGCVCRWEAGWAAWSTQPAELKPRCAPEAPRGPMGSVCQRGGTAAERQTVISLRCKAAPPPRAADGTVWTMSEGSPPRFWK